MGFIVCSLPKLPAQFHPEDSKSIDDKMLHILGWADPYFCVSIGDIVHLVQEVSKEGDDIILQLNR